MKNASYATNGAQLQLAIHSMGGGGFLILHTCMRPENNRDIHF